MNIPLLSPEPNKESIEKIAKELTKIWYKRPEYWIGIIGIIIGLIALLK